MKKKCKTNRNKGGTKIKNEMKTVRKEKKIEIQKQQKKEKYIFNYLMT